jgi:hypothetical protein
MRLATCLLCAICAAAPALGQPLTGGVSIQQTLDLQSRLGVLHAQQDAMARQAVVLQNQLTSLDIQLRGLQAIEGLREQGVTPTLPPPAGPDARIDPSQLASIPDDRLAASNARVQAVVRNQR